MLEGVAFGLRDSKEALTSTGAHFDRLIAIGGGTGSRYWIKLIATVLDTPLHLPKGGEFGAALGAARLGIAAISGAAPETFMFEPDVGDTIEPVKEMAPLFDASYQAFRDSYPKIKSID